MGKHGTSIFLDVFTQKKTGITFYFLKFSHTLKNVPLELLFKSWYHYAHGTTKTAFTKNTELGALRLGQFSLFSHYPDLCLFHLFQ